MDILLRLLILIVSYLLGSVSSSIIVGKIKSGKDIRTMGSGNAGATNTLRTFGKAAALLVVLGDGLKTVISVLFAKILIPDDMLAVYIAGIGCVLGHNFPVFYGFKGGKGVLVSIVSVLFANWQIGLITFVISILIMIFTKYVSLGSIIGSVIVVVLVFILEDGNTEYLIFSVILAVLCIYRHRANIVRLIKGTENKLGSKKEEKANG